MNEFERRYEQVKRDWADQPPYERTYALLAFHLEWAEAVKSGDPGLAIQQYRLAEEQQSTIGTYATGSGEGLASMAALYEIMGKRADLIERLADAAKEPAAALGQWSEALAIWTKIQSDPNGMGEDTPAADRIRQLQGKLAKRKK